MLWSTTLLPLMAAVAYAQRKCGNTVIPASLMADAKYFQEASRLHDRAFAGNLSARTQQVGLYFHVVASDKTVANGCVTQTQLDAQYKALNDQYEPTGIHFKLLGTDFTINAAWATHSALNDETTELEMKKALRKGTYKDLNVYLRPLGDGLLGICEFPAKVTSKTSDTFYKDGCQVLHSSVPGGSATNYDEGKTATHEIGHWFGLFHTFQGGCSGGDSVDDTPAESTATQGCPKNKNTCTGSKYPGNDPIANYMDYSYDSCMNQFTSGQSTRIYQMWDLYRAKSK